MTGSEPDHEGYQEALRRDPRPITRAPVEARYDGSGGAPLDKRQVSDVALSGAGEIALLLQRN
jgi:hypothetical protein